MLQEVIPMEDLMLEVRPNYYHLILDQMQAQATLSPRLAHQHL